jgi:membrane-associated phospholipid phosphatase
LTDPMPAGGRPLLPARLRWPAAGLIAACVAVTTALGVWLAGQSRPGWLDARVDGSLSFHLLSHYRAVTDVKSIGNPMPVTLIVALLTVACLATRRYRGALLVLIGVPAAAGLTELILKPLVDRTLTGFLSFPSTHVTSVSAMAVSAVVLLTGPSRPALPAALRWLLSALALLAVAAVAVAMVALHFHYFTDTIGGAAVGTGTILLAALILDRISAALARREQPARQESTADDGINAPAGRLPQA